MENNKVFEGMVSFFKADRKYVRIRWNATGEEEIRYVKVINPGRIDLLHIHENSWSCSAIYPVDIGNNLVTILEVMDQPA